MTAPISPKITTTEAQLKALSIQHCSADKLVEKIAHIALSAQAQAQNATSDTIAFVDDKYKVTLHSKGRHLEICDDCAHETWAPGLIKIENIATGQAFSFDDVALHQMVAHHKFTGEYGWRDDVREDFGFKGEVNIAKACKVLELADASN